MKVVTEEDKQNAGTEHKIPEKYEYKTLVVWVLALIVSLVITYSLVGIKNNIQSNRVDNSTISKIENTLNINVKGNMLITLERDTVSGELRARIFDVNRPTVHGLDSIMSDRLKLIADTTLIYK